MTNAKKILLILFSVLYICSCKHDNETEKNNNLFEEPIKEWGISTSSLKSKIKFPVYDEWYENNTITVKLHDVKLIGNNPSVIEYQNTNKDLASVAYYFVNDDTVLNAVECVFSRSVDYNELLEFLRNKYGIEKSNSENGLSWSTGDTYILLSKPNIEELTVTYFDIHVFDTPKPVSQIKITTPKNLTLSLGEVYPLIWQVTPSNAKHKISIASDTPEVVMVVNDESGLIKANMQGEAKVIVKVVGSEISDTCLVKVQGFNWSFENVKQVTESSYTYDVFYEKDDLDGEKIEWASGNEGFALIGKGTQDPSSFPTYSIPDGKVGKGVKLVTKSTGDFGAKMGIPIAAGNLFIGTFNVLSNLSNLSDALKATKLGMPFEYVPTYLKGYYKYKAGEQFEEDGQPVLGKKDTWDVYAVFYEVTDDCKMLDGTIIEGNYTHPNIVSVAFLDDKDRKETDEWTKFYIPFKMNPGKIIDKEKLKKGGYNVSIVFSSSKEGYYFRGSQGSTLCIDEVELEVQ